MGNSKSAMTSPAIKSFVDGRIAEKKIMVFSKSWCSFCAKAKKALQPFLDELDKNEYEILELDKDERGDAIQDYMKTKTGARSVPRVFVNGQFLGGGDETAAEAKNGKLRTRLNATPTKK